MDATSNAFFLLPRYRDGDREPIVTLEHGMLSVLTTLGASCENALEYREISRGQVFCVEDDGAIRLVAQMAVC